MSRIFNISFDHKGRSYTALVSVAGKADEKVNITTYDDKIRITLANGTLVFSIHDLFQKLLSSRHKNPADATIFVTESISLQLM